MHIYIYMYIYSISSDGGVPIVSFTPLSTGLIFYMFDLFTVVRTTVAWGRMQPRSRSEFAFSWR